MERREEEKKNGSFQKDLFPRRMTQSGELAKAQTEKEKKKKIAPEHIFKPSQQEIVHILLLNRIYIRYIINIRHMHSVQSDDCVHRIIVYLFILK